MAIFETDETRQKSAYLVTAFVLLFLHKSKEKNGKDYFTVLYIIVFLVVVCFANNGASDA